MSINRKLGDLANVLDDGTEGQVLSFNASGKIAASTISTEGTLGTLTQSFDSNQTSSISLSSAANTVPFVSVFKEVPQIGISSKGQWDVNSNGTNYDFYDEKPISYSSSTLTPSATGDGTFTNSNAIVVGYQMSSTVSLNSTSPSIAGQGSGGSWQVVEFDPTGNHVYMVSGTTQSGYAKTVYQYTMSTPHDLSTLNTTPANTLDMSSKIVGTVNHYCPLHITNSGYDLYFGDYQNDIIYQWKMSTAYDLSTASYHGASSAIFVDTMASLFIQPNGLTGYQVQDGAAGSAVLREFTMTTAWDITTASLSGTTSSTLISRTQAVTISPDGTLVIASDAYGSTTSKYFTMSPGYDLSSLSSGTSFTWQGNSSHTTDTRFSSDGALLYGWSGTYIYNYTTGTTAAFNAADVGKKVVGNSGSAIITSAAGAYKSVTAFADTSAISSWQLFGAQGKSDGSGITLSGFSTDFDISSAGSELHNTVEGYIDGERIRFNNDGTRLFVFGSVGQVYRWDLSTAYDLNTISFSSGSNTSGTLAAGGLDFAFNSDGSYMYMLSGGSIYRYTATNNAFTGSGLSVSLSNTANISSIGTDNYSLEFSSDGTKLYIGQFASNFGGVYQLNLTSAWDPAAGFTNAYAYTITEDTISSNKALTFTIRFVDNGSKMLVLGGRNDEIYQYTLSTAWDLSTASYSNKKYSNSNIAEFLGFDLSADNSTMFTFERNNSQNKYRSFNISDTTNIVLPYSTYSPALTNSSTGQINSSTWLDINSMTADETKNSGDIFYAVSTDNRTSWGVAKGSDGVRKIAKNNSGTWQYNNDAGSSSSYDFSNPTAGATSTFTAPDWHVFAFNTTGTKFISLDGVKLKSYNLSTAWDISTISSSANAESTISTAALYSATISADGTKLIGYHSGVGYIYEYTMSTPFDVTTLTADGNTGTLGGASTSGAFNWVIKPGTYDTVYALVNRHLYKYTFTGGSIITGTVTRDANFLDLDPANQKSYINNGQLQFKPDGTEFYIGQGTDSIIERWVLSTPWDITTATKSSNTVPFTATGNIWLKPDGTKIYYVDANNSKKIDEYNIVGVGFGISETWVNGTNNNEHATLQEALGAQAFNRMNKAQLDAVADDYHFSQDSADTLDLMIAPYAASGTSPISDGVTINYNAGSKYKQAIHGTEYDVEFTTTNSVDLTSKISANLKARVL